MSLITYLEKRYDSFKVSISQWEILDQGVTVLTGPSGSGKTSVIRLLCGLETVDRFEWHMGDIKMNELKTSERKIGWVPQQYELFPHLSVYDNIYLAGRARKIPQRDLEEKLQYYSGLLNLSAIYDRKAAVLSGGEQQRVALVRALVGEPRILFLDEPFSALDSDNKNEARSLVRNVLIREKIPVLLVTHDQQDIDYFAKKISTIQNGSIVSNVII